MHNHVTHLFELSLMRTTQNSTLAIMKYVNYFIITFPKQGTKVILTKQPTVIVTRQVRFVSNLI